MVLNHSSGHYTITPEPNVTWATSTGKIGELFDAVIDSIIGKV